MALSVFDLFTVGIGPSSSHTVGPMRAARSFAASLEKDGILQEVRSVRVELFGSLGATGHGHGSVRAVVLGLLGEAPDEVDPAAAEPSVQAVRDSRRLALLGRHTIDFDVDEDVVLHRRKRLPFHTNGMRFTARGARSASRSVREYFSVGGGFVLDEDEAGTKRVVPDNNPVRYPFTTAAELLAHCRETGLPISQVMLANELSWRTEDEVRSGLLRIWSVMQECVERGCRTDGVLPGALKVRRRAAHLRQTLAREDADRDHLAAMDWVTLYALAVNEENASGGRVVTAPTNGAAGIIPAVLHYYQRFIPTFTDDGVVRFLLTAAAIGVLFKENASISGAEVGCQGRGRLGVLDGVGWVG